jgi:2-keto-3-deoxy-L-rhamnonate aldolase RhmA
MLGQTDHEDAKRLMDRVAEVAVKADMPFGVATGFNPEVLGEWLNRGASFVSVGIDFGYITSGATRVLKGVREVFSA